jgi:acyl-coenzyme A thioesterase PaaI-like protein
MDLSDDSMCFVCGKKNPIGLKIDFDLDRDNLRIAGTFVPRREHQGYSGIMHGGLASTLLDEAMVKLLWEAGIPAVSATLEIKLLKPVKVGERVMISGWVTSRKGRIINTAARLVDEAGVVLAEATARCIRVSVKEERGGETS